MKRPSYTLSLAGKRAIDVLVAASLLVLCWPLMLGIGLLIRWQMGGPVFYRQQRPGLDERLFTLYKFRTMSNERGPDGRLLPDGMRLGRLGRFLRSWSLDEIPQLWNVLKGDMSLVGPRPLILRYLARYSPRQRLRHRVKPGITGLAQVRGRNNLDWNTRLELDSRYAETSSLWLDIKILVATFVQVFSRTGVCPGAGAELDEFWGAAGPPAVGPRAFPVEENEVEFEGERNGYAESR